MDRQVQRETVEYNSAIYGMANQLALLNIARAKENLPTSYSAISRLSGTITVKTAAGFGASVKAAQPTRTASSTDQTVAGTGTTNSAVTGTNPAVTAGSTGTMSNTITSVLQDVVARGGNVYSPSISGEIDSGPSFDIEILDTQSFYRGILSGIDGPTLLNFIDQGVDSDLIFRLLVYRVVFKATESKGVFSKGQVVHTWTNPPIDADHNTSNGISAAAFWPVAACYELTTEQTKNDETSVALVNRVLSIGSKEGLRLADLAALDGTQLALRATGARSGVDKKEIYIGSAKVPDDSLLIVKPILGKEVAALYRKPDDDKASPNCLPPDRPGQRDVSASAFFNEALFEPEAPSMGGNAASTGSSKGELKVYADGKLVNSIHVEAEIIPRSTEGVVQYLGAYIRAHPAENSPFRLRDKAVFAVKPRCAKPITAVDLGSHHYCVEDDADAAQNMKVIALVEQLINLNKVGSDRPATQPVQVVP